MFDLGPDLGYYMQSRKGIIDPDRSEHRGITQM